MRSIWYFVGVMLTIMGTIITVTGFYRLVHPPAEAKVLARLHPDLFWGLFMLAFGLVFAILNRRKTVR